MKHLDWKVRSFATIGPRPDGTTKENNMTPELTKLTWVLMLHILLWVP